MSNPTVEVDKPLPGIGVISACIAWVEAFITTISAPLLTFVAVLTVASAFQGGNLIQDNPILTQAYSWSLGIGIEGQLAAMAYNARKAAVNGRGGQAVFYWIVTVILYVIGVLTGGIIAYQQANHIGFDEALKAVGVPTFLWDWGRVVVMFGLIVLAAATRYVKPAPRLSVEEELAEIERKQRVAAAKRQGMAQGFRDVGGMIRGGIQAAGGRQSPPEIAVNALEQSTELPERDTQELPIVTDGDHPAEPKGFRVENQRGLWWDAPSYQQFILAHYGRGISPNKAMETVRRIGGDVKGKRTGSPGAAPYIAQVSKLKTDAKATYGDGELPSVTGDNSPAFAAGITEQMAE